MKYYYVIVNYDKPKTIECGEKIVRYMNERGAVCRMSEESAGRGGEFHYTDPKQVPRETECVIVLGGDGTLIQAAHDLRELDCALFGVNLGHVGYLSEIEGARVFSTLDSLLGGQCFLEERMALQGDVLRGGAVVCSDAALNDVVLARLDTMRMIHFSLYVDGQFLTTYHADGIVVATPTGSTAYSFSAGGPIVLPTSNLFVLTPISAHTLTNTRSIVLPEDVTIELAVEEKEGSQRTSQAISYDSDHVVPLQVGDRIRICRAKNSVKLVRLTETSFLENLAAKLR